jgi:hypothetical protein
MLSPSRILSIQVCCVWEAILGLRHSDTQLGALQAAWCIPAGESAHGYDFLLQTSRPSSKMCVVYIAFTHV